MSSLNHEWGSLYRNRDDDGRLCSNYESNMAVKDDLSMVDSVERISTRKGYRQSRSGLPGQYDPFCREGMAV